MQRSFTWTRKKHSIQSTLRPLFFQNSPSGRLKISVPNNNGFYPYLQDRAVVDKKTEVLRDWITNLLMP